MRLAKSIMLRQLRPGCGFILCSLFFFTVSQTAVAQDNSPYSRYGLGDLYPGTNTTTRGMGGISSGYADVISVNFSNPASYSQFQTTVEQRTKKLSSGRVILDVGLNFSNRSLIAPGNPEKFTSGEAFFSYLQVGLPIRRNWGLTFGIRPVTRMSYLITHREMLKDPITSLPIDSAVTSFEGRGGAYLPTIGTGFAIGKFSAGVNVGYLFGNKDITTRRNIFNDSVSFTGSLHNTTTSFGGLFLNAGLQYVDTLSRKKDRLTIIRFGASGNWKQNLNASQDILRESYFSTTDGASIPIDSVSVQNGIKGKIIFPSTYKAGVVVQTSKTDGSGWLAGVDYSVGQWSEFRYYGQQDSVQNSQMINFGAQIIPRPQPNYFSRVVYRFGGFTGMDYVKVKNDLPVYGVTLGLGLPIGGFNRQSQNQFSTVNIAMEYAKRGNNDNLLKENLFRVSVGIGLTDLWFLKRKYE
jgi:hypothetical protein